MTDGRVRRERRLQRYWLIGCLGAIAIGASGSENTVTRGLGKDASGRAAESDTCNLDVSIVRSASEFDRSHGLDWPVLSLRSSDGLNWSVRLNVSLRGGSSVEADHVLVTSSRRLWRPLAPPPLDGDEHIGAERFAVSILSCDAVVPVSISTHDVPSPKADPSGFVEALAKVCVESEDDLWLVAAADDDRFVLPIRVSEASVRPEGCGNRLAMTRAAEVLAREGNVRFQAQVVNEGASNCGINARGEIADGQFNGAWPLAVVRLQNDSDVAIRANLSSSYPGSATTITHPQVLIPKGVSVYVGSASRATWSGDLFRVPVVFDPRMQNAGQSFGVHIESCSADGTASEGRSKTFDSFDSIPASGRDGFEQWVDSTLVPLCESTVGDVVMIENEGAAPSSVIEETVVVAVREATHEPAARGESCRSATGRMLGGDPVTVYWVEER